PAVSRRAAGARSSDLSCHPRCGCPLARAASGRRRFHRESAADRGCPTEADLRAPGAGGRQYLGHLPRLPPELATAPRSARAHRQDLPPFDDLRVRRAFYHAIDTGTIVRQVLQGYAAVATGQFPPSSWAFDASVKVYPYDPIRAKALLAEAGWKPGADGILVKDGKRLSFSLRHDQANQSVKDTAGGAQGNP